MRPRWMTNMYELARELLTPAPTVQHEPWQRIRFELPEPAIHVQATGEMMPIAGGREWHGPPGSLIAVSYKQPYHRSRNTGALPMLPAPAPQQTGAHRKLRRMRIDEVPTDRNLRLPTPADEQEYAGGMAIVARALSAPDFAENDWLNDPIPPMLKPLNTDALAVQDRVTLLDVSEQDCAPVQDEDVEPTMAEQDRALYQLRVMLRGKRESE